jgi:hypothetical protein
MRVSAGRCAHVAGHPHSPMAQWAGMVCLAALLSLSLSNSFPNNVLGYCSVYGALVGIGPTFLDNALGVTHNSSITSCEGSE